MVTLGSAGKISLFVWDVDDNLPSNTEYNPNAPTSTTNNNFTNYVIRGWLNCKYGAKGSFEATMSGCVKSSLLMGQDNKVMILVGAWNTASGESVASIPFFGYIDSYTRSDNDAIMIKCKTSIRDSDGNQIANSMLNGIKAIGARVGDIVGSATYFDSLKKTTEAYDGEGSGYTGHYY